MNDKPPQNPTSAPPRTRLRASAGTRPQPQTQSAPPAQEHLLGRYRVLERRGKGGFGTVCTCWDERLQRRVAIKRMPLAAETGTTAAEALAEARMACMLGHPNIVTVFDFESDGTYAYLVMEYVDGLNLAELLARVEGGRLTPAECAHVLQSVATALAYAHENRALHLDIKPTNIMIDRQGVVKLADFGMATLASAAGYGGARGGTVGYMPPEQIDGDLVDERTDAFALAVVVWQALTGVNPFLARTAEESRGRIMRGPGRLSKLCPELDPAVERILLEELSPSPAGRTADVRDFADELGVYLGQPQEGASSLRELVAQAEKDDATSTNIHIRRAPIVRRLPQGLAARALTAVVAFAVLRALAPYVPGIAYEPASVVAPLVAALVSALWPPAATPLAALALAAALAAGAAGTLAAGSGTAALSLFLAALVLAGSLAWWISVGRHERLSSLAVLVPCCLPSPVTGAAIAGYALGVAPAATTTLYSYLFGTLLRTAVAAGFDPATLTATLIAQVRNPLFWCLLAGSVAGSAVASALAERGSAASGVAGQILGFACVATAVALAARMENTGIWLPEAEGDLVLALLLSMLMCIATVLRGPLDVGPEGEE